MIGSARQQDRAGSSRIYRAPLAATSRRGGISAANGVRVDPVRIENSLKWKSSPRLWRNTGHQSFG
jgi:hypothetical protein